LSIWLSLVALVVEDLMVEAAVLEVFAQELLLP
jgi:hypothetical protein